MAGEWEETTLADVSADVAYGYTESASDEKVGPRFLRITDIQNGVVDWHTVPYCPISESDHLKYRLHSGDIVVARTGNSTGENYLYRGTEDAVYASYLIRFRVNQRTADPAFVWYNMRTQRWQDFINSSKTGSAQAGANAKVLGLFPLTLPPLAEQKAIAAVLGALDDKIELNRRMNATLEAMARALFQSWFVDFDPVRAKMNERQPANLDPTAAVLFPDSFQNSDTGQVPKGWTTTTIGREVDFFTGFAFQSEQFSSAPNSIRMARGDNVKEGFFHWDSKTRYWPEVTPELERYRLKCGDVLIGMDGSKVGKNWVRVRNADLPCLLVQRVARLRAAQSVGEHFLWLLISDLRFRFHVEAVKTGTSIPHISGGQIKSYEFVRPPIGDNRLFQRFEELVRPLGEQMDANIGQSRTLATLRDTLLPKLLSGEVKVTAAAKVMEVAL